LGYSGCSVRIAPRVYALVAPQPLWRWSDLPTTTEQDIAKLLLQVADDLETEDQ
jgi:hypothetical protein